MIYIIIPNYNGKVHLETCLSSLMQQDYKNFKIVLIDNNSSDDSVDYTKTKHPETAILELSYNTGFSKATNEGIKYALKDNRCEYILLLNNDIELEKNFLTEILKGFINDGIGSVGCKMLNYYNRNILDDTGNFIDAQGYPYKRSYLEQDTGQYEKPEYIFGACAGAAIYKRKVFDEIGFLDEDFFAYYEDIDYSLRMQLSGYRSYYNPKAVCYHKGSSTSGSNSNNKLFYVEKNLLLFKLKNYPLKKLIFEFPMLSFLTIKRFAGYFIKDSPQKFWWAFKGFLRGVMQSKNILKKRKNLKKIQKISFYDIQLTP